MPLWRSLAPPSRFFVSRCLIWPCGLTRVAVKVVSLWLSSFFPFPKDALVEAVLTEVCVAKPSELWVFNSTASNPSGTKNGLRRWASWENPDSFPSSEVPGVPVRDWTEIVSSWGAAGVTFEISLTLWPHGIIGTRGGTADDHFRDSWYMTAFFSFSDKSIFPAWTNVSSTAEAGVRSCITDITGGRGIDHLPLSRSSAAWSRRSMPLLSES